MKKCLGSLWLRVVSGAVRWPCPGLTPDELPQFLKNSLRNQVQAESPNISLGTLDHTGLARLEGPSFLGLSLNPKNET